MDFFGIGQAIESAATIVFHTSRGTGRTTRLIESLKPGDKVVFNTVEEARHFKRLCKERDIEIETQVVPVKTPEKIFDRGTPQGRLIFDHGWVEQFYMNSIKKCGDEIRYLQTECGGWGEAHENTRRSYNKDNPWLLY